MTGYRATAPGERVPKLVGCRRHLEHAGSGDVLGCGLVGAISLALAIFSARSLKQMLRCVSDKTWRFIADLTWQARLGGGFVPCAQCGSPRGVNPLAIHARLSWT